MNDTRELLEDRAEHYIRTGGFGSFSFRDLAQDLGIKSSSVHYHFSTKSDLGTAVTKRYTRRFEEALADPKTSSLSPEEHIRQYIMMFYTEMTQTQKMCLCAVLSVEKTTLSDEMNAATDAFYTLNLDWLTSVFLQVVNPKLTKVQAYQRATQVLATLQGGLIGASARNDIEYYIFAARGLYKDIFSKELRFANIKPED